MDFNYQDERFADLQLLRYRLNGFERLSARQKVLVYYLSKATLFGRDITFDQFGKYNLRIRKMLEVVYGDLTIPHDTEEFLALEVYLILHSPVSCGHKTPRPPVGSHHHRNDMPMSGEDLHHRPY